MAIREVTSPNQSTPNLAEALRSDEDQRLSISSKDVRITSFIILAFHLHSTNASFETGTIYDIYPAQGVKASIETWVP